MSTSLRQGNSDISAEADRLCQTIEKNAAALRTGGMGRRFDLDGASFVLHASARNTIYRVSARYAWFLKLTRDGNVGPMEHERLGAATIDRALGEQPRYRGSAVTRVSLTPPYVLASTIQGQELNRLFVRECWTPGAKAATRNEDTFRTLGTLLAILHRDADIPPDSLPATTRPFEVVDNLLRRVREPDHVTDTIAKWQEAHRLPDAGTVFQHGNFRLDNILRTSDGVGLIDFENCGTGSPYQDLSRPVVDLVLTRALVLFPSARAFRCIGAFLEEYSRLHQIDASQLWKLVSVRMARYYLEARARRFRVSIGGLPVSKTKLNRLTLSFLDGEKDLSFYGVVDSA